MYPYIKWITSRNPPSIDRDRWASGVIRIYEARRLEGQLLDQFRSFQEILHPIIRRLFQCFLISPINKNGFAAGIEPTVYVSPSISDHETFCKINFERFGRLKQHPGPRFTAVAGISVSRACVEASHNTVDRKLSQ